MSHPIDEPAAPCVLVVEDHDIVREMCTAALESFGYEVIAVTDASAALQIAAERTDLLAVLTDVALREGQTGIVLAHQLRERLPDLAVVVMTGRPDSAIGIGSERRMSLLLKPFTMNELKASLRGALNEP